MTPVTSGIYRATLVAVALASLVLAAGAANAHSQATYYHSQWSGASPDVGWKFSPSFPSSTGPKADRMKEGANAWDNASNHFAFTFNGAATQSYNYLNPCAGNYSGVFEKPSSEVQYGETRWCENGHVMSGFTLAMQEGTDAFWDTGGSDTGTNVYRAVATHELGHATGFGTLFLETQDPSDQHFPFASQSTGICWDDADFQTMCNGLIPAPSKTNSLEEHDIHTLQDQYGT